MSNKKMKALIGETFIKPKKEYEFIYIVMMKMIEILGLFNLKTEQYKGLI